MGDGRLLANDAGEQVAAFGSVVAPGFARENTNAAFDAENAELEAGRAGTDAVVGDACAIPAAQRGSVMRDPLLEQMMAEEAERTEHHGPLSAGGLKGAAGRAGARDARKLDKLRRREQ